MCKGPGAGPNLLDKRLEQSGEGEAKSTGVCGYGKEFGAYFLSSEEPGFETRQ